jgi:hypothetical protein
MVLEFNEADLNEIIELIAHTNKEECAVRYFGNDKVDILSRIQKRLTQEDVLVLVEKNDLRVTGYCEVLVDKNARYTQLLAHFSSGDILKSLDAFLKYLIKNYHGFQLHYVLSDQNKRHIDYMSNIKATNDGFETMMLCKKEDYHEEEVFNVFPLKEMDYNYFIAKHNSLFGDAYWTGELILSSKKFDVYVAKEGSTYLGYSVVSKYGRSEEEIYFLIGEHDFVKKNLVIMSLNKSFENACSVQILLEEKEISFVPVLTSLGFKEKERIITYYIKELSNDTIM